MIENVIEVKREPPDRIVMETILIVKQCVLDGKHQIADSAQVRRIKEMDYYRLADIATAITVQEITTLVWPMFQKSIDPRDLKQIDYCRALMCLRYRKTDYLSVQRLFTMDEKEMQIWIKRVVDFVKFITTEGVFEL